MKDDHIITLQSHPEYHDDIIELFFKENKSIPEELIDEGRKKFNKTTSQKFVSKFFNKFLENPVIIYV